MNDFENLKIGFIGGGALAESVIKGISGKLVTAENIFVSESRAERCEELKKLYGVNAAQGAENFLGDVKFLILAVKPKDAAKVLSDLADKISFGTTILSVIAGLKMSVLEKNFPNNPVVRVMPNVALAVGEGMTCYAPNKEVLETDRMLIKKFWSATGRAVEIDEKLMDAVTGLSGSGPAYGFLVIDALADGGVAAGLPRNIAIELAAQTLLGAAKMVLETGSHPDALRDRVTSPAGTTIEGVRVLERGGVRSAFIEAVIAAAEKSKSLG